MIELKEAIQKQLSVARQEIIGANPFLQSLHLLTPQEYITFAKGRYQAASGFEELLKAILFLAQKSQLLEISAAVQRNLNDEQGITEEGIINHELAHSTWREDFYSALGICLNDLKKEATNAGSKSYQLAMLSIIQSHSLWQMVGALLALEATIPAEFQRIQKARDKLFPKTFIINNDDSAASKARKYRARRYLDDHIVHDAHAHYPDLLQAILKEMPPEQLSSLIKGIQQITKAKIAFYQHFLTETKSLSDLKLSATSS